jgi:hypothetical protein
MITTSCINWLGRMPSFERRPRPADFSNWPQEAVSGAHVRLYFFGRYTDGFLVARSDFIIPSRRKRM